MNEPLRNATPTMIDGNGDDKGMAGAESLDDPRSAAFASAFGARLVDAGLVDEAASQRAQRAAQAAHERFDHVLTKLGLIPEQDLTAQLAAHLGMSLFAAVDAPPIR